MASFFQIHPASDARHAADDEDMHWLEVCPPTLSTRTTPMWRNTLQRLWNWLWDLDVSAEASPSARAVGLDAIKDEFCRALWDLHSPPATVARDAVQRANSLRELWHLRADLFNVIAMHRGQAIASARLDILNAHFPVRITARSTEQRSSHTTQW